MLVLPVFTADISSRDEIPSIRFVTPIGAGPATWLAFRQGTTLVVPQAVPDPSGFSR